MKRTKRGGEGKLNKTRSNKKDTKRVNEAMVSQEAAFCSSFKTK